MHGGAAAEDEGGSQTRDSPTTAHKMGWDFFRQPQQSEGREKERMKGDERRQMPMNVVVVLARGNENDKTKGQSCQGRKGPPPSSLLVCVCMHCVEMPSALSFL